MTEKEMVWWLATWFNKNGAGTAKAGRPDSYGLTHSDTTLVLMAFDLSALARDLLADENLYPRSNQ